MADNRATPVKIPLECVEIYVPKKVETLSRLYEFLRSQLNDETGRAIGSGIDGYSLYEVDGAFRGKHVYQERTLVIRVLFPRPEGAAPEKIEERIAALGQQIASTVALGEEELWICHYPQQAMIFRSSGV
jgi:hypothetical protein